MEEVGYEAIIQRKRIRNNAGHMILWTDYIDRLLKRMCSFTPPEDASDVFMDWATELFGVLLRKQGEPRSHGILQREDLVCVLSKLPALRKEHGEEVFPIHPNAFYPYIGWKRLGGEK